MKKKIIKFLHKEIKELKGAEGATQLAKLNQFKIFLKIFSNKKAVKKYKKEAKLIDQLAKDDYPNYEKGFPTPSILGAMRALDDLREFYFIY